MRRDITTRWTTASWPELGLRFLHVPGHTPGGTFIVWQRHGGILFSGDTLVGPKPGEPLGLSFPPLAVSDDDATMRAVVRRLEMPRVRHIVPFHGEPLLELEADDLARMWNEFIAR